MVTFFSFLFSFFFFLPSVGEKANKKIGLRPLHSRKKFFDVPLLLLFFLSLFWEIILFHFVPPLPSRAPQVGVRGETAFSRGNERPLDGGRVRERQKRERERESRRRGKGPFSLPPPFPSLRGEDVNTNGFRVQQVSAQNIRLCTNRENNVRAVKNLLKPMSEQYHNGVLFRTPLSVLEFWGRVFSL